MKTTGTEERREKKKQEEGWEQKKTLGERGNSLRDKETNRKQGMIDRQRQKDTKREKYRDRGRKRQNTEWQNSDLWRE